MNFVGDTIQPIRGVYSKCLLIAEGQTAINWEKKVIMKAAVQHCPLRWWKVEHVNVLLVT